MKWASPVFPLIWIKHICSFWEGKRNNTTITPAGGISCNEFILKASVRVLYCVVYACCGAQNTLAHLFWHVTWNVRKCLAWLVNTFSLQSERPEDGEYHSIVVFKNTVYSQKTWLVDLCFTTMKSHQCRSTHCNWRCSLSLCVSLTCAGTQHADTCFAAWLTPQ